MPQTRAPTLIGRSVLVLGATIVTMMMAFAGTGASSPELKTVSAEVQQALRMALSGKPEDVARGEGLLKRMGPGAASEVRLWLQNVSQKRARAQALLAELEGVEGRALGMASLGASEFLQRKILECRSLAAQGEYARAVEMVEAILLLDRKNPSAWLLHRMARQFRERRVARDVLEPIVEVEKLVYEVGEQPAIKFRLVNHRRKSVNIKLLKGVLGEIDVSVTKVFFDGNMRRDQTKLNIRVPSAVKQMIIGPGDSWEHQVQFDVPEPLPLSGVVVRVRLGGRFRPSHWSVEGVDENLGLTAGGAEFWIVPPGEAALCERPLEKLTAALFFGRLEPFFVGGQLSVWAGQEDAYFNEKLVVTLVNNMEHLEAIRLEIAGRLLSQATGRSIAADPKAWKEWLKKSKE